MSLNIWHRLLLDFISKVTASSLLNTRDVVLVRAKTGKTAYTVNVHLYFARLDSHSKLAQFLKEKYIFERRKIFVNSFLSE